MPKLLAIQTNPLAIEITAVQIITILVAIPALMLKRFRGDSGCDLAGALRLQIARSRCDFKSQAVTRQGYSLKKGAEELLRHPGAFWEVLFSLILLCFEARKSSKKFLRNLSLAWPCHVTALNQDRCSTPNPQVCWFYFLTWVRKKCPY